MRASAPSFCLLGSGGTPETKFWTRRPSPLVMTPTPCPVSRPAPRGNPQVTELHGASTSGGVEAGRHTFLPGCNSPPGYPHVLLRGSTPGRRTCTNAHSTVSPRGTVPPPCLEPQCETTTIPRELDSPNPSGVSNRCHPPHQRRALAWGGRAAAKGGSRHRGRNSPSGHRRHRTKQASDCTTWGNPRWIPNPESPRDPGACVPSCKGLGPPEPRGVRAGR